MEAKHTPGPWSVDAYTQPAGRWAYSIRPHRQSDGVRTGFQLAYIEGRGFADTYGTMGGTPEANARLIAAAPDLLEALREADIALEAAPETTTTRIARQKARAAIARATAA